MSRVCPQCSHINPDSTVFCTRCGYRFQGNEQAISDEAAGQQANLAGLAPDADPSATLTPGSQQASASQAQAMPPNVPSTPAFAPNMATPSSNQPAGFMPPQPQQGGYPMQSAYGQQPYGAPPMAMQASGSSLQRAFADKGTPVRHQSWLIDGKQAQPPLLRNTLIENIQRQGVMGVNAVPERLREQGVVMEERDYVRVQYGASSIFVYMAPMGQSLYISRTSTVQQPYSRIRIGVVLGLFVLMLLSWLLFAIINPSFPDDGFAAGAKTFFGYAFFGLLFFFVYLLLRAVVSAIAEKDFLAYLRPHILNDFTLDALSAVEQITDKGIRETVKQAGLNPAEITPAQGFPLRQPLHQLS